MSAPNFNKVAPTLPPPPRQSPTPVLTQPVLVKRIPQIIRAGDAAHSEPGTISLNFDKASLRTVIDAILGDALGVPYTVDERVDGVVTLVSPQKLGREEALKVLDGVLRLNGATLIKGDNLYRVALIANARQNLGAPSLGVGQPGYAISVYVARHTAPATLQRLLDPLYQIPGALQADGENNLLLITGSVEERRALMDAARLFDQDWLANRSVGIFPLRYARPKALADELHGLIAPADAVGGGQAQSGAGNGMIRVSPIERLNAVMVVTQQPEDLDLAASWISRLDQAGAGDRRLHVYSARYAQVDPLAKTLSRLFSSGGGGSSLLPSGTAGTRLTSASSAAAPAGAGPAQSQLSGAASSPQFAGSSSQTQGQTSGGLGSSDHPLGQTSDTDIADQGDSSGPRIIADGPSHSLLILANASEYAMIEEALGRLDIRPVQVMIEATIVEVTLNKTLQYGVQYYLRGTKLLEQDSSVGFNSGTSVPISPIAPGFNAVLGSLSNPSIILSALDQVTQSKVLSAPQLLVTDSHEALLKVGTQTPLLTGQLTGTLTTNAPIQQSVEYHDTGVILRVLPHTNDTDMVSLDIAQEVSEVVPTTVATLTPDISERRIESSVTIQSGQTVLLGGLISESTSAGREGLPILSAIPGLGALFGDHTDSRLRTELIVFITPHVLHDGDDAQRLSDELVSRMPGLKPPEDSRP